MELFVSVNADGAAGNKISSNVIHEWVESALAIAITVVIDAVCWCVAGVGG